MLELRRGRVTSVENADGRSARVVVEVDGEARPAVGYPALIGPLAVGDEVIVNVEALRRGLGSGGFDIVCANLTHGLGGSGDPDAHVMKLNYTPLQHAVRAVEEELERAPAALSLPVVVLALHGQLPPAAFALSRRSPGARVGYVQTAGGALPGQLSDVVADLLAREMIADHVTVAPCFGGLREAITLEGALHAGSETLGWDAALVGPGPGIIGSASALGHGGMAALHSAHAALSLGCPVTVAPRMSSGDPRERHRGVSHHTAAVLSLLLRPVEVAVPEALAGEARAELERAVAGTGHVPIEVDVDQLLRPYEESGLPAVTMGRKLRDDEDFFRAALAAGVVLAERIEAGER
jgi:Protein of unknown function (DUF3866)